MQKIALNKTGRIGSAFALVALSVSAMAQTAPNLTSVTDAARNQFSEFLTGNVAALVSLTLLVVGFKFVMKMIKKGVK